MGRRSMARSVPGSKVMDGLFPLALLALSFFAGTVGGFLVAVVTGGSESVAVYLKQYMLSVGGERMVAVPLFSVVWDVFRWPALILCLGCVRFRVIAVPVAMFFRGLFLSYAISVMSQLFAGSGFLIALVSFGVNAVFVVPVLFVMAYFWTETPFRQPARKDTAFEFSREKLIVILVCGVILVLATIVQWAIMPSLLTLVCARL